MWLVYSWAPDSRLASSGEGNGPPAAREPSAEPWEKGEERRSRRGSGGRRGKVEGEEEEEGQVGEKGEGSGVERGGGQ